MLLKPKAIDLFQNTSHGLVPQVLGVSSVDCGPGELQQNINNLLNGDYAYAGQIDGRAFYKSKITHPSPNTTTSLWSRWTGTPEYHTYLYYTNKINGLEGPTEWGQWFFLHHDKGVAQLVVRPKVDHTQPVGTAEAPAKALPPRSAMWKVLCDGALTWPLLSMKFESKDPLGDQSVKITGKWIFKFFVTQGQPHLRLCESCLPWIVSRVLDFFKNGTSCKKSFDTWTWDRDMFPQIPPHERFVWMQTEMTCPDWRDAGRKWHSSKKSGPQVLYVTVSNNTDKNAVLWSDCILSRVWPQSSIFLLKSCSCRSHSLIYWDILQWYSTSGYVMGSVYLHPMVLSADEMKPSHAVLLF